MKSSLTVARTVMLSIVQVAAFFAITWNFETPCVDPKVRVDHVEKVGPSSFVRMEAMYSNICNPFTPRPAPK